MQHETAGEVKLEMKGVKLKRVQSIDETIHALYLKISKSFKTAFTAAMIFGLIAHLYMFMNKLPNYDDMGLNGFGATFRLGRWFLWVLGAVAYHLDFVYSLPWVNGLVTLIFIALSAGLVADLFQIKSMAGNVVLGAAMAVYPSWTATFFFMFTAPYYAIALCLAVCAVCMTVKGKRFFLPASVILACSLGIYQAYFPFAAAIYVIVIILTILKPEYNFWKVVKQSFYYLGQLATGGIIYFIITKFSLEVTKQQLADYKGVDAIGSFSGFRFVEFAKLIVKDFFGLAYNNNLELSYNYVTKFMYFFLFALSGALIIACLKRLISEQQYLKAVELTVMGFCFVIAVNSIYIVCKDVYSLMRYPYVSLLILPMCLIDQYKRIEATQRAANRVRLTEWVTMLILTAGILSYCHYANAQYLSLHLGFEQASAYYGTVITQIKELKGYDPEMKTAFIGYGSIEDRSLYRNQVMEVFDMSGRDTVMAQAYSIEYFLKYYCGFDTKLVEMDADKEEIKRMPVYPAEGSIKIVDDIVVVKFAN